MLFGIVPRKKQAAVLRLCWFNEALSPYVWC